MRLRKSDIKAAEFTGHLDPWLMRKGTVSPSVVAAYYRRKLEDLGYTFHYKRRPASWKWGRYAQTLRRRVYLGTRQSWAAKKPADRAVLLAHEYAHAVQMRAIPRWLWKYIASPRFRWEQEAQAYRQSVRAYRRMGYPVPVLRDYAHAKARSFPRGYLIGNRRLRKDIAREMPRIMLKDFDE